MGLSPLSLFSLAAAALRGHARWVDVVADNVANSQTPGFKAARLHLEEIAPGVTDAGPAGGVRSGTLLRDFEPGPPEWTGIPLDLAVQGEGFFAVRLPSGQVVYTRTGLFRASADRRIVTPQGLELQPGVTIPEGATEIVVQPNGDIQTRTSTEEEWQTIGSVQLARFANPQGLEPLGEGLYRATGASGPAQAGRPGEGELGTVLGGYLEASGVDLAQELVQLLMAQRGYSAALRSLGVLDRMQQQANQLLG